MTLQSTHPWLPRKMVWGGLPWVAVLIQPVLDALFAAKKADAALSNPLLMAHQPAMDLLVLIGLHQFHGHNAQVADRLVGIASFATALVTKPVAHHATIL